MWIAVAVWTAVLVAYHWYPFDFRPSEQMLRQKLPVFLAAPFSSYYWGSEFHAFTELSRKLTARRATHIVRFINKPQP